MELNMVAVNNKKSKFKFLLIFFLFILFCIILVISLHYILNIKEVTNPKTNIETLKELNEYLQTIDTSSYEPNRVIAKINDQEILYFEYLYKKKQLESYEQTTDISTIETNPLLNLAQTKVRICVAKDYYLNSDELDDTFTINVSSEKKTVVDTFSNEDTKQTCLNALSIDQQWLDDEQFLTYMENYFIYTKLSFKGTNIIFSKMFEDENIQNKELQELINKYNTTTDAQSYEQIMLIYNKYLEDLINRATIDLNSYLSYDLLDISFINDNTEYEKIYDKIYIKNNSEDSSNLSLDFIKDKDSRQDYICSYLGNIAPNLDDFKQSSYIYYKQIEQRKDYEQYMEQYDLPDVLSSYFQYTDIYLVYSASALDFDKFQVGYEGEDLLTEKYSLLYNMKKESGGLYLLCIPNYYSKNMDFVEILNPIQYDINSSLEKAKEFFATYSYMDFNDFEDFNKCCIGTGYINDFLNVTDKYTYIDETNPVTSYIIGAYSLKDICTYCELYYSVTTGELIGGKIIVAGD